MANTVSYINKIVAPKVQRVLGHRVHTTSLSNATVNVLQSLTTPKTLNECWTSEADLIHTVPEFTSPIIVNLQFFPGAFDPVVTNMKASIFRGIMD